MKPAAGLSIIVAAMLVSLASLSPSRALADELPKDTNQIESLTPEQAKTLLAEFKGQQLQLSGLTALDAATAKTLAEFKGRTLQLNGLTVLDAATAKALAEFKGGGFCTLTLNGLTTLDADTAKALAEFKGFLNLNGLPTLNADTAKALAELKGAGLFLNGLTTLDAATAKMFAEFKGPSLELSGLTVLDAATAKALAEFKGRWLKLNGLTTLDANLAKTLAEFEGDVLVLGGLTALDAATTTALAEFKGCSLSLDGLTALDADLAKTLAEFKGQYLFLNGLPMLDADTAKALTDFEGRLAVSAKVQEAFCEKNPLIPDTAMVWVKLLQGDLKRLTTLDAATAKTLAESKAWDGQLPRITAFESPDSVEIAAALAKREGPLLLPNLTKISPKTLTALIEKEDVEIPLIETLELIQEPDGSPTEDFVIPKGFETRQKARQ